MGFEPTTTGITIQDSTAELQPPEGIGIIPRWVALLLTLWAWAAPAEARTWTALYAFGDSYSDSGAGYVDGNGPTAIAYLATNLGIPFTYAGDPHESGKSLNFAVSGARTGKSEGVKMRPASAPPGVDEILIRRGMQDQVADFARRVDSGNVRFDPGTTLFFLAGGLNDRNVATETSAANLEGEIRTLYEKGGRYFLLALLPRKIPEFAAVGIRLDPAIARIPERLKASLPGIHVELSQWGGYFDAVIDNPARYGITNTTERCAGRALDGEDSTPCADPDARFYFHAGHPSTAVHKAVGRELEREAGEVFR